MAVSGGDDDDLPRDDSGYREIGGGGKKKKGPSDDRPEPVDTSDINRRLANEPCNDLGNSQRWIQRFGRDFIFVEKVGWFFWDGTRWNHDAGKTMSNMRAQDVPRLIWAERDAYAADPPRATRTKDEINSRIGKLAGWAEASGQLHAIRSMVAASEPHLTTPLEKLDADPLHCPCENGTVELGRESWFRESRRTDLCTRKLGVKYVADAKCPRFETFLTQIMPDFEMRAFLQRIFGYSLCGSTSEQVIFLFYGSGNNGKSTLLNIVRHVLGDYAMISPVSTFLAKREGNAGSEPSPDIARLPGARLVTASEPPEGARLDEGRVKEMTGGEPMTARHLNQPFFTFKPVFKLVLLMNNLPTIRGVDHGIWRRIRLVPFTVQIADDKVERDLDARLIEDESPGILQWMIRGFESYKMLNGLEPPAAATAAVNDYRADQDMVGEFLAECCVLTNANDPATDQPHCESAKKLRTVYRAWCEDNGLDAMGTKSFGAKLSGRGLKRGRLTGGARVYSGVVLRASWATREPERKGS